MPPFKSGLKRRADSKEPIQNISEKDSVDSQEESEDEELINGQLDAEGDDTDSEHEQEEASDHEQDEVLFDDSADSTLGEDEQVDDASDESSDLTDSEAGEETDEDDSEGESENSNDEAESSVDSGAESGPTQLHSGASDSEQEKKTNKDKNQTSLVKKGKENKKSDSGVSESEQEKQTNKGIKQKKKVKSDKKQKSDSSIDKLADTIKKASVSQLQPVAQKDEYESGDTSDEEDRRNTVGDVPMWWYNEYPHVGYDLDGRRIIKPPQRDQIDEFLKKCEDPDFWRTVRDPSTGQDVVLSKQDLELIHRLREGHVPDPTHDEYKPWVEWFTREVLQTPLRAFPEHKRSFLPSRSEQQQIGRIVHALKMGWTKTRKQLAEERRKKREKQFYNLWGSATAEEEQRLRGVHKHIPAPRRALPSHAESYNPPPEYLLDSREEKQFYNLWGSATAEEEQRLRGVHKHIPAPRRALPSHAESYNPPPEYLLDSRELKEWNKLSETPWKRKYTFLPTQYASLRHVPAYERFTRERFLRCLDLYLAPRAIKMRLTISPEDLVPKLPSPRDLQPFPTAEALLLRGHAGLVRSADFEPAGQYVVSGGDDGTVRVWETSTGRCLRTITLNEPVARVAWIPAAGLSLVAAAVGNRLLLINPGDDIGAHRVAKRTDELLEEPPPKHDVQVDERTSSAVEWQRVLPEEWARGVRLAVRHFRAVTHVAWHARGDYVCVTLRDAASRAVVVHQVSRRRSQLPFTKAKGLVQCALFHPTKPLLFVATQRVVRVYDLVKQELVRKLLTGAQWISHMAVHPAGDNLLVASYDRKCIWFDLELSSKPYQTLRLHGGAVRALAFHKRYPLFASAGDDDNIIVSHGMVYNDLLQNPLLVPLKQLRAGARGDELCVLDVRFHPTQPWLLAAGADSTLRLYT